MMERERTREQAAMERERTREQAAMERERTREQAAMERGGDSRLISVQPASQSAHCSDTTHALSYTLHAGQAAETPLAPQLIGFNRNHTAASLGAIFTILNVQTEAYR